MLQAIVPGAKLDIITREEFQALLREYTTRQETRDRFRAPANVVLDANGIGVVDVFTIPLGWECEVRRVFIDLSTASESNFAAGSINLNGANVSVQYLRSDTRIEWGLPVSPLGGFRVPGLETWGKEQGPYLRNGEVFRVRAVLGAAANGATLTVVAEGIKQRSGSTK